MGGVPWMIGQAGARHPVEVARSLAYLATGGKQGIARPSHMKVRALAVPGTKVRVAPGACALINRQSGGGWRTSNESYISSEAAEVQVDVPANTSAVTRLHVLARIIKDSQYASNPAPSDVVNGPYDQYILLTDVGADRIGILDLVWPYSGLLPLARIAVPPNTSAIQQAHINDWREVVTPRIETKTLMNAPINDVELVAPGGAVWPTGYTPTVSIPWWATHMSVVVTIASIGYMGGSVNGTLAVRAGAAGATQWRSADTTYDLDVAANDGARTTLAIGGSGLIDEALRGTDQVFAVEGSRLQGTGRLVTRKGTHIVYDIKFSETPV